MSNYKNLLEVVGKSNEEISFYLEDVNVEQFKQDVIELSKINIDKYLIGELIEKLQSMV